MARDSPTKSSSSKSLANGSHPSSPSPRRPSPSPHKKTEKKSEEDEDDEEDDEDDDKQHSMFFFENYHKISDEHENLKKKMEVEMRIKQEMRDQIANFEQKIKELETQRSEMHRTSVERTTRLDAEVRALMEKLAAYEEKITKLEKQKEEFLYYKSTPPLTPKSITIEIPTIRLPSSTTTTPRVNSPHLSILPSPLSSTPSAPVFATKESKDGTDVSVCLVLCVVMCFRFRFMRGCLFSVASAHGMRASMGAFAHAACVW
jgi:hypothetical protein